MRTAQLHLQRSTETLLGYLQGITCDDHLNDLEIANLQHWLETHDALRQHWPFDEITARVQTILQDSVIDEEERADLLEWCADLALDTHPAYDLIDMATRQLHGVLHGIQSDGKVTEDEVYGLRDWLEHFRIFRGAWPFSEAFALVGHILEDNHVSTEELSQLHAFCMQFSERPTNLRPVEEKSEAWAANAAPYLQPVGGICQHDIPVIFEGKCFCFTGGNKQFKRATLRQHVVERGGRFTDIIVRDLDYLVLCEIGSRLWVYASYGRKVEAAMREGIPVIAVERFLGRREY